MSRRVNVAGLQERQDHESLPQLHPGTAVQSERLSLQRAKEALQGELRVVLQSMAVQEVCICAC